MGRKADDFKIGLLVILALACLLALTYKVGKFSFKQDGYALKVTFVNASAVEKNAPVRLSGVEVGKVKDLRLVYGRGGTRVLLTLWLKRGAKVRKDSEAYVTTLGLMGEKYVELTAGSADSPFLRSGSTITGREPFDTARFIEKGEKIADNLDQAITDVRRLTGGVNEIIAVHRQDMDKLLKNLIESSQNMKAFSEDIKWHPWKLIRKSKPPKEARASRHKSKKNRPR